MTSYESLAWSARLGPGSAVRVHARSADSEPELLLAAVRRVAAGGRFIAPALAERMAFEAIELQESARPHERLTHREDQILRLLVRGLSINQVAEQLVISNKTVSTHKARLMRKMDLRSNADLVRYGVQHGLCD